MKSEKRSIKKKIKKIILIKQKLIKLNKIVGVRDKLRRGGTPPKPIQVGLTRGEIRRGVGVKYHEPYEFKDYGKYIKPEFVDYDAIIIISSYERYDELKNILNKLYSQETRYSFKIIILNDGSTDKRYINLKKEFKDINYLLNDVNGGVKYYWRTINKLFAESKKYKTSTIIQMDDDFTLCDSFLDRLMDKFFELKEENNSNMLIKYHLGKLDSSIIDQETFFNPKLNFQSADGGTLFDQQFMELINYNIDDMTNVAGHGGSWVWHFINGKIIELGVMCYILRKSLVFHDCYNNSKMHPTVRSQRNYNTINFIDNE